MTAEISLRPYEPADATSVLELLTGTLGWLPDDQHAAFFAWKHLENPAGPSPAWVAVIDGEIAGFRTFLRWGFERGGELVPAVRAVDTATSPAHQGRGVFRALTMHALDAVRAEGVAFVFNTPNDQSRPGYLKMGWQTVRRLPVLSRPRSPAALARLARARTPAALWSTATGAGEPAGSVFADERAVGALLDSQPAHTGLRTRRTPAHLAWRYGFEPLGYRVLLAGAGPEDGLVVFRLRRRGPAVEAAVCDGLAPGGDARVLRRLLRRVVRACGADHAVRLATDGLPRRGHLPVPRQGPTLVWRSVTEDRPPAPKAWQLSLGDVELF